jgi:hypothetical protein
MINEFLHILWRRAIYFIFGGLLIGISCAPVVKTDLKNFMENPEEYKGKSVIITADLKSILANPSAYKSKKIELSGKVTYYRRGNFYPWNFILTDDDKEIKCYEKKYRVESWIIPVMLVSKAYREKGKITVVGRFNMRRKLPLLELDWIEYKGEIVDTDYIPSGFVSPFW